MISESFKIRATHLLAALLLTVANSNPTKVTAETTEASGHYSVSEIPAPILSSFIESVRSGSTWKVPVQTGSTPDGAEQLIWAGSELQITISLGNPAVTFARGATGTTDTSSFTLDVNFEPRRIVLKSSHPDPKMAAGVAAPYSATENYKRFVPGLGDTGFVALVPKTSTGGDWVGVAICPRSRVEGAKASTFTATSYAADSLAASGEGKIFAKQRTGQSKAWIGARIRTSQNIARPTRSDHSLYIEDPRIDVEYFPDKTDTAANEAKLLSSGMLIEGELTAATGSNRKKRLEAFARAVPFQMPGTVTIPLDGQEFTMEGGNCTAIIRGILFEETYSPAKR